MYTVNHWPKHISMIFTSNHKFYRDEDDKINLNDMKKKIINWSAKHWQRSDSYFNSEGTTDLWILIKMHLSKSYHTMYQQQSNNWCFLFISLRRILGKADDFRTVEKSYVNIFFLQLKKICSQLSVLQLYTITWFRVFAILPSQKLKHNN